MQARRFVDPLFYDFFEFDYEPPLFEDNFYDDELELYAGSPYIYGESDCDDFDVEAADSVAVEDYLPPHQRAKLGDRPTSDVSRMVSWRCCRSTCYRSWKARRKTQYH